MKPIRILLADDHALVRAGFRSLLEEACNMEVVAEAGNGREAVQLVETHRPDVVLMDIAMSELNGLDAAARISASSPDTRVIILSMNTTEEYVHQALRAGAVGYVPKSVPFAELDAAIRAVTRGETYLSPTVAGHVVTAFRDRTSATSQPGERLTPRQREVLQLIAEGKSTKQIAHQLGISAKTAEGHRTQLMRALDIHDIAGLVRFAIRAGLISPE